MFQLVNETSSMVILPLLNHIQSGNISFNSNDRNTADFLVDFRKCRQVQTLGVSVSALEAIPQHFLELESAENMTQGHLRRIVATSVEQVLRILSRWRHLRRLTLSRWSDRSVPPIQVPRSQCRWLQLKKSGNSAGQSERFHHG